MNNDYKKIIGKNQTRYILEMSAAGSTSVGTGATNIAGSLFDQTIKRHQKEASSPWGLIAAGDYVHDWEVTVPLKTGKNKIIKVPEIQTADDAKTLALRYVTKKYGIKNNKISDHIDIENITVTKLEPNTSEGKSTPSVPKPQNVPAMIGRARSGAGAHRNKRHEMKAGKEKHRKPYAEGHMNTDHEISMASNELESVYLNAKKLLKLLKHYSEMEGLEAWQQSKITKAADYLNSVLQSIRGDHFDVVETEKSGISKGQETKFHTKLDKLVHDTFGKREVEKEDAAKGRTVYDPIIKKPVPQKSIKQQAGGTVSKDGKKVEGPGPSRHWLNTQDVEEGSKSSRVVVREEDGLPRDNLDAMRKAVGAAWQRNQLGGPEGIVKDKTVNDWLTNPELRNALEGTQIAKLKISRFDILEDERAKAVAKFGFNNERKSPEFKNIEKTWLDKGIRAVDQDWEKGRSYIIREFTVASDPAYFIDFLKFVSSKGGGTLTATGYTSHGVRTNPQHFYETVLRTLPATVNEMKGVAEGDTPSPEQDVVDLWIELHPRYGGYSTSDINYMKNRVLKNPNYKAELEKEIKSAQQSNQRKALGMQGVAEDSEWRQHPDAYDVDDEGNKTPRNPNSPKFGYDPLQRRADTANDAKTPRGKMAALKTSLKMAKGNKGVAEGVAGPKSCWPGHRKIGTQPGTGKNKGKRVNKCEKIGEDSYIESLDTKLKELTTETNKGLRPGHLLRKPGVKNEPNKLGQKVNANTAPFKKAPKKTEDIKVSEKAPPGDKYERMVKHIKKGYSADGKLTDVERRKAYGAAWKAKNKADAKK